MQAIETKYLGPTNSRGSRIKATSASGICVTVGYKSQLSSDENHVEAAKLLCRKLGWETNKLVTGSLKNSMVHVFK